MHTGMAQVVYRHFPHLGENSYLAALASECAGEQGAFWEYHDSLYIRQGPDTRGMENLEGIAASLGLDTGRFSACVFSGRYDDVVRADFAMARELGVGATPTILVLRNGGEPTGAAFEGAPPFDAIAEVIDGLLSTPAP